MKPTKQTTLISEDGKRYYKIAIFKLNDDTSVFTTWRGELPPTPYRGDDEYIHRSDKRTALDIATARYNGRLKQLLAKGYKKVAKDAICV